MAFIVKAMGRLVDEEVAVMRHRFVSTWRGYPRWQTVSVRTDWVL